MGLSYKPRQTMQQFLQNVRENLPLEMVWVVLGVVIAEVINIYVRPHIDSTRKKKKVELKRKKFEHQKLNFLMVHAFKTGQVDTALECTTRVTESVKDVGVAMMLIVISSCSYLYADLVAVRAWEEALCRASFAAGFAYAFFLLQHVYRNIDQLRQWRSIYLDYEDWKKLFAEHGVNVDEVQEHHYLDDE